MDVEETLGLIFDYYDTEEFDSDEDIKELRKIVEKILEKLKGIEE